MSDYHSPCSVNNNNPVQVFDCSHRLSQRTSVEGLVLAFLGNAGPSKLNYDVYFQGTHHAEHQSYVLCVKPVNANQLRGST